MSRSYRVLITAVVGWLILAGATQHHNEQGQKAKGQASDHQTVASASAAKPESKDGANQAATQQCERYDGGETDCTTAAVEASVEQTRDADWQANAAALNIPIGLLTFGAAVFAANWAKKAAFETGVGAKAAIDAVNETRKANSIAEQGLRTNRPWLGPKPFTMLSITNSYANGRHVADSIGFVFGWKNWGTSPAVDVAFIYYHKFVPVGDVDIKDFEDVPNTSIQTGFIGPTQDISAGQLLLQQTEVDDFRSKKVILLITNKVSYRDARESPPTARHETSTFIRVTHIGRKSKEADGDTTDQISVEVYGTFAT